MKKAYLWVWVWTFDKPYRINADLVFSSREKYEELRGAPILHLDDADQLVEIQVPDEFDDWDYIPDNY
jgi:hypothetical protein